MPKYIRTRLDIFADMHKLFMRQAPAWSAREEWQKLVRELDEAWQESMKEVNNPSTKESDNANDQLP